MLLPAASFNLFFWLDDGVIIMNPNSQTRRLLYILYFSLPLPALSALLSCVVVPLRKLHLPNTDSRGRKVVSLNFPQGVKVADGRRGEMMPPLKITAAWWPKYDWFISMCIRTDIPPMPWAGLGIASSVVPKRIQLTLISQDLSITCLLPLLLTV